LVTFAFELFSWDFFPPLLLFQRYSHHYSRPNGAADEPRAAEARSADASDGSIRLPACGSLMLASA
jgi:hypothetical protein